MSVIIIFLTALLVIELLLYAYRSARYPDRDNVYKRLVQLSSQGVGKATYDDLLRKQVLSEVPLLDAVLRFTPGVQRLERIRQQAKSELTVGFYILLSLVLLFVGSLASYSFLGRHLLCLPIGIAAGMIPWGYLCWQRKKRMEKLERQLPEALDLIGRSLRAGHAFTSGMKLAADEYPDPLGTEFARVLDEVNFGVSMPDALRHLAHRMDCPDLKLFVVSAILQRETGSNLVEILQNISGIIRERQKLYGKIRILSAEGRLSAWILVCVPFAVIVVLRVLNPKYINMLFQEPALRIALVIAGALMLTGIIVIKRLVSFKV